MSKTKLKVSRIGNSRGVRLPATVLRRYQIGDSVIMEELAEGILLRPSGSAVQQLSWEDTARAMAASLEDWGDWDLTAGDGLDAAPWKPERSSRVAEPPARYRARTRRRGRG